MHIVCCFDGYTKCWCWGESMEGINESSVDVERGLVFLSTNFNLYNDHSFPSLHFLCLRWRGRRRWIFPRTWAIRVKPNSSGNEPIPERPYSGTTIYHMLDVYWKVLALLLGLTTFDRSLWHNMFPRAVTCSSSCDIGWKKETLTGGVVFHEWSRPPPNYSLA